MTRRVTIVMDETGISCLEGSGRASVGDTAPEALGVWVYQNRHALGLEIELVSYKGVFLSPPEIMLQCER